MALGIFDYNENLSENMLTRIQNVKDIIETEKEYIDILFRNTRMINDYTYKKESDLKIREAFYRIFNVINPDDTFSSDATNINYHYVNYHLVTASFMYINNVWAWGTDKDVSIDKIESELFFAEKFAIKMISRLVEA